jgi:acyl-CoA synthetase (AMP-forming)/AMP-acid ligase II/acyl carrier protein
MRCLWTIATGGTIICPSKFEAALFFDWVEDFQPTWYSAVPTIHQAVLAEAPRHRAARERRQLRFAITNSAPMPPKAANALEEELGVPVLELYGCSETCSATLAPLSSRRAGARLGDKPARMRKPGSVGVPLIDLAVMNEAGCLLAAGEVGEIVMRGDTVTAGYLGNDEAQHAAFTGGWFRSGDLGYVDEDGFVFVNGRLKEIINRGGEKIAPLEVDMVLLNHSAVAQAATFAVPHETLGEEVAAVVVLAAGMTADAEEIRAFAAEYLSPQKTPRQILISGEIPKSRTGKIARRELAGILGLNFNGNGLARRSECVAASTPLEKALQEIWADVLGLDQVGVTENLFRLGGNSLTAMQIAGRIADTLDVELPAAVFFEHSTIAELAKIIEHDSVASAPC